MPGNDKIPSSFPASRPGGRGARPASISPEDAARVEGFLRGEERVFGEVEGWIRATLRGRYRGLADEHEDLAQTVHGKLFASLKEGRFAGGRGLRAYVAGVVHHVAIDRIRERYRARLLSQTQALESQRESCDDPYRTAERAEESRLLHQALLAAPRRCRELWQMAIVERMSYEEIGEKLSIPAGTVKSRMWHCRRKALSALRRLRLLNRAGTRRE